jgi:site-specific DNA recombinase
VNDPQTGRRVSRQNPPEAWITTEVPDLRIVDDALWADVKQRQGAIAAEPRVAAIKATHFWEKKRQVHLLTGLLHCGYCGGGFAAVGRDYVACSAARKLGTCSQRTSVRRAVLEEAVLALMRDRLMRPDAVAAFVTAYAAEVNQQRGGETADRAKLAAERTQVLRKLEGLYDAIADGLRTAGLKERLEALEARKAEPDTAGAAPEPTPVRLHPNLAAIYRRKVAELAAALTDPEIRPQALETIRELITRVTVRDGTDGLVLELEGALTAMIGLAQNAKSPPGGGLDDGLVDRSVKVVAGTGFEPVTFRL